MGIRSERYILLDTAEVVTEVETPYTRAVHVLETYFKPKTNTTYEGHIFRNLSQGTKETMMQYVALPDYGNKRRTVISRRGYRNRQSDE